SGRDPFSHDREVVRDRGEVDLGPRGHALTLAVVCAAMLVSTEIGVSPTLAAHAESGISPRSGSPNTVTKSPTARLCSPTSMTNAFIATRPTMRAGCASSPTRKVTLARLPALRGIPSP